MSAHTVELSFDGHRLLAVPSVHFRHPFAEEVNRLCWDPDTRPGAIAVELGPETARAVADWLQEFVSPDPETSVRLPCMYGLMKTNRRIHPSKWEAAQALMWQTGKDLHELPPRVLKESLGYSQVTVLYLSPADSIVEAVRCALELGVPLYGVDLEETADPERDHAVLIEDPALATPDFAGYVARNAPRAEAVRDLDVDGRRERAMAARLKSTGLTNPS